MTTRGGRAYSRTPEDGRGEQRKSMARPTARSSRSANSSAASGPHTGSPAAAGEPVQSNQRQTIVLEDDDDDVQYSSPRSFAQARSSGRATRQRGFDTAPEDPLELRLGRTGSPSPATLRLRSNASQAQVQLPAIHIPLTPEGSMLRAERLTIDLTSQSNDDCIVINATQGSTGVYKRKRVPTVAARASGQTGQEPGKEPKLVCPICMDVMKEETSTKCGHVFCRDCILGAIAVQKKCPACRHKLTNKCIYRIYLSGSLRIS